MNTIPSIFNENQINCTVFGGTEESTDATLDMSVILLNSGGNYFREPALENLINAGFKNIISMENYGENYTLDECAKRFPMVKFFIPQEKATKGQLINIAMNEVVTDYVFIISDNLKITKNVISPLILENIKNKENLCIVPHLMTEDFHTLPLQVSAYIEKKKLQFSHSVSLHDNAKTLYPFDFIGIYNVQKFIRCGGFDYTIKSEYWQNLDFFFRSWLWGETCTIMPAIRLYYQGKIPVEDSTVDESYLQFFLKNIAPCVKTDYAYIPIKKIFSYSFSTGKNFFESIQDFKEARKWVQKNKYRYKYDLKTFIKMWETEK
ncbi:MAG: hypothetical protein GX220_09180 [Treponema sp.]|nr:hypothetical protein [Treponema sp.]